MNAMYVCMYDFDDHIITIQDIEHMKEWRSPSILSTYIHISKYLLRRKSVGIESEMALNLASASSLEAFLNIL